MMMMMMEPNSVIQLESIDSGCDVIVQNKSPPLYRYYQKGDVPTTNESLTMA